MRSDPIYQTCKRYDTTHHFHLLSICMKDLSYLNVFLLYLYVFCCLLMQGLVNDVIDICLQAEHKWCAHHTFANWSKQHRGEEMKKQFWKVAWFTFEEEFVDNMRQLGEVSSNASKDLMNYPPHTLKKPEKNQFSEKR